jgi:nucleoside-diphosphate-sugar epimerase
MGLDQASLPRVLIVGGAGYFGARLAEALAAEHAVTITQRSSSAVRDAWIARAGLQTVHFDSANAELIDVAGAFDAIINLAMPGAAEAARDPAAAMRRALATARACVRLLDEGRALRLLHFSTFHVYGAGGREVFSEDDAPAPIHPYGHTHLACEQLLGADSRVWMVRPSNMVGAPAHADLGDQAKLMFVDLCQQAARGAMKLNNDGLSYRDFLPFDDAITAVRLLLTAKPQSQCLFNLAHGSAIRLDEAARLIRDASPVPPTLEFGSGTDAFRQPFGIKIERLQQLGWQPQASLAAEAARLIKFFA